MIVFLDTTALAALFLDGDAGRKIRAHILHENDGVAISIVTTLEFVVFLRDLAIEAAVPGDVRTIAANFLGSLDDLLKVQPDLDEASLLVVKHDLGPSQAQVLASAMKLRDQIRRNTKVIPDPLWFASLDDELNRAASAEGIPLLNM